MFALIKRLSSTVRRLAERHARLQGQVLKLEAEAAAVGAKLSKAKTQLDAISLVLPTFDGRVQPDQIGAIAGWDHCYGKRGAFQAGCRQLPWPVDDNYLGRFKADAGQVREAGLA